VSILELDIRKSFFLGEDATSVLLLRLLGWTWPSSGLRDFAEEKSRRSAMDLRFFRDLGLPFSSAMLSCREDSSRKVSNSRDFFRVGDGDPSASF
jgi:hypothetical protein